MFLQHFLPATPRGSQTIRTHDDQPGDEDHESKRARLESSKKQRVERLSAEYASMIRAVKVSTETFHTMDEYEQDLQLDDHLEQDVWEGEDEVTGDDIPSDLWSSCGPDQHPEEPAEWIDRLADYVELKRLCSMDVLSKDISSVAADASQLTTKFVYDWRLKVFKDQSGAISKRWLRRSRLVAREFAFLEKRSDTYAPATSTHILNLLCQCSIFRNSVICQPWKMMPRSQRSFWEPLTSRTHFS